MAIARVQTAALGSTSNGTSQQTSAFAANPTVGNYLVAWGWGWSSNTSSPVKTFTDTATGNTWTTLGLQSQASDLWCCLGLAKVANTGASFKVTLTNTSGGGSGAIMVVAREYSGILATSPQDGSAVGTSGTTGVPAPGSLSFTAGDLVVGVMTSDQTTYDTFGYATPTGFSRVAYQDSGSTFQVGEAFDALGPTSPTSPTYKTGTVKWAAAQLALKATASGLIVYPASLLMGM